MVNDTLILKNEIALVQIAIKQSFPISTYFFVTNNLGITIKETHLTGKKM